MYAAFGGPKRYELLVGLVFLTVAITLTLAVGESAVRVVASRRLIYNIEMVRYATQLKMPDPLGEVSHVHRPSSHATLMGVDVSLNALGDRGPELREPRDRSRKRILVLGSSITMGWGVPLAKTFVAMTERHLNTAQPFGAASSFELVNAGIGNYNTAFQHVLFARQFPVVRPDMVVLHYFVSDVQPRTMGRNSAILRHSYLAAFLFDRWSLVKLRLGGEYQDLFAFYSHLYANNSPAWRATQQHIREMRDTSEKAGVPFVVMITPDIHDLSDGTPYQELYARIGTAFDRMGIPTVNTFDAFQRAFGRDVSQVWIQPDDPHPNAKGHALMADALYQYIVDANPLKLARVSATER